MIKDLLGIERVLTKEEIAKELILLRKQKVVKGLTLGCVGTELFRVSPIVDKLIMAQAIKIKNYLTSTTLFFGLYCPVWGVITAYLLFVLLCIALWYGEHEVKPKKAKQEQFSIEEWMK